jgi:hypothetical protein
MIQLNPSESVIDESSILFAIAADDDAVDVCAFNGEADKKQWSPLFASNRKTRKFSLEADISWAKNEIVRKTWDKWRKKTVKVPVDFGPLPSIGRLTSVRQVVKQAVGDHTGNALLESPESKMIEERITEVTTKGSHMVICVIGMDESKRLMRQIEIIVAIVRSTHSPPILVVAHPDTSLSDSSSVLKFNTGDKSQLYLVEGDPKRVSTLLAAGVKTCEAFMTLAPTAPPNAAESSVENQPVDSTMMDRENLLTCGMLEHHLTGWGRSDLAPLYDWYHPESVKFMSPPPTMVKTAVRTVAEAVTRVTAAPKATTAAAAAAGKPQVQPLEISTETADSAQKGGGLAHLSSSSPNGSFKVSPAPSQEPLIDGLPNLLPSDVEFARSIDSRGHYRFASGRVMPKPMISSMFSMAYYTVRVYWLVSLFWDRFVLTRFQSSYSVIFLLLLLTLLPLLTAWRDGAS